MIYSAIYAGDLLYSVDDSDCGFITSIDSVDLTHCADISISDNAADELIAADAGNLTDCADKTVLDYAVVGLMMLMG